MTEIYVTKTKFEKNASDGIEYFTDLEEMATHIQHDESCGGTVQVYKCTPVSHELVYIRTTVILGEPE